MIILLVYCNALILFKSIEDFELKFEIIKIKIFK